MPTNIRKEDIRNKKTQNTLNNAMFTLLRRYNFKKITVSDLCEEAEISRATFYAHFNDKYDLLRILLATIGDLIIKDMYEYDELERGVNQFIQSNNKVITNILKDANGETLMLVREFMSPIVNHMLKRNINDMKSLNDIIFINFITGGLVNLLTWIVENDYPQDVNMINTYLYNMLSTIAVWDAQQEHKEDAKLNNNLKLIKKGGI